MDVSEDHDYQTILTVSQLARRLGLSRARFYQLLKEGVFPPPVYCCTTRQPMYTQRLQELCLKTRKTGIGVNGQFVRFYDRRKSRKPAPEYNQMTAVLREMGLAVTTAQVNEALSQLKLSGAGDKPADGEITRTLFKYFHKRCQDDV